MMKGGGGQNQVDSNASPFSPSFARVAVGGRKGRGRMYGGNGLVSLASNDVPPKMLGGRRTRRTKRQKKAKTSRRGLKKSNRK